VRAIDHGAAEHPYLQLAAIIRDGITDGTYPRGRKLPSNLDLVEETGLSPMTIRRAMRTLASEGLVQIVPGRGTYVI
jgi:GntR family transcriptional regulator